MDDSLNESNDLNERWSVEKRGQRSSDREKSGIFVRRFPNEYIWTKNPDRISLYEVIQLGSFIWRYSVGFLRWIFVRKSLNKNTWFYMKRLDFRTKKLDLLIKILFFSMNLRRHPILCKYLRFFYEYTRFSSLDYWIKILNL